MNLKLKMAIIGKTSQAKLAYEIGMTESKLSRIVQGVTPFFYLCPQGQIYVIKTAMR
jgi:DNA-binding Xre family transcriptional regulator